MDVAEKSGITDTKKKLLWFDELSTLEVKKVAEQGTVIIFPVGSVEEHGEHLPLCTDSIQPEYVALEVAKKSNCLVAPPLRYGLCNSTRNFPGTLSIGFDSLFMIIRDILSELNRNGFNKVIVLSGHAGSSHMAAIKLAAQNVVMENIRFNPQNKLRIMVLSDFDFVYELKGQLFLGDDGHAGDAETSRVMSIRSDLLKSKGKPSFPEMPRFEIVPDLERYFPSGVMGDPTKASESKGKKVNEYVIDQLLKLVKELSSS